MPPVSERREPAAHISPARAAAFTILQRVATTAAHADDLLHAPATGALQSNDRNLATALVLGVLRWQLALDARIRPLLQRPDAELHPAALLALRLAIFQMEHLERIPAHAAINESVELTRANGAPHAAAMVNALLRRLLREKESEAASIPRQTLAAASPAELAHPQWLVQRWRAQYGGKAARQICGYDQREPAAGGLFYATGEVLPQFDDGSRLIAELAAAAAPEARRVLDCCAAPGGKTLVLAHRLPEAEIVAVDISERRLATMRSRLERDAAGSRVTTLLADMTDPHQRSAFAKDGAPEEEQVSGGDSEMASTATTPEAKSPLRANFDLILCDAPCSGTGTLARNPEIRHRLQLGDLPRQAERQRAILRNALKRLAPGGRLLYSTCSLEPEENEAVLSAALAEGGARVVSLAPLLDEVRGLDSAVREDLLKLAITPEGALRTLPGVQDCDGFYAVLLERAS